MNNEYGTNVNLYDAADTHTVTEEGLAAYFVRVMTYMLAGIGVTAIVAIACVLNPLIMRVVFNSNAMFIGLVIAQFAAVIALSAFAHKLPKVAAQVLYFLYAVLTGVTFSMIGIVFSVSSIVLAFVAASAIFGAMAIYGATTKRDLSRLGTIAMFGLIGVLVCGLINVFLGNTMFEALISCAAIAIFMAFTAYDIQKIRGIYIHAVTTAGEGSAYVEKTAIIGALSLYLDFINLFIRILSLFGKAK
ncbi:MAG: Bax inhibitor-1/YccA family protein [Oscillospiraceae bacterium]|jgi:FtsH-binding integral membrane protein|nr:Bax inhibitor-1/YccA family protein [Oscillospiraceae bacterium]